MRESGSSSASAEEATDLRKGEANELGAEIEEHSDLEALKLRDPAARGAAARALGHLRPSLLREKASLLAEWLLREEDTAVRAAISEALCQLLTEETSLDCLGTEALAALAPALAQHLQSGEAWHVKRNAISLLSRLEPRALAELIECTELTRFLWLNDLAVQLAVAKALACYSVQDLKQHESVLIVHLVTRVLETSPVVRRALAKLLVQMDPELWCRTVCQSGPSTLAEHTQLLADALRGADVRECQIILRALRGFAGALLKSLDDPLLGAATVAALGHLPASVLMEHATASDTSSRGTLLHAAASYGDLATCKKLVEAGSLPFCKNKQRLKPVDLARANAHDAVVEYLQGLRKVGEERLGSGAAYFTAMQEKGVVTKVEWHLSPMRRRHVLRRLIVHSFLKITVQQPGDDSIRIYVLEKSHHPASDMDQFRCGVTISAWEEVVGNICENIGRPFRFLAAANGQVVEPPPKVADLRQVAVELGPYTLGRANCHHGAMAAFNRCARPHFRVSPREMPNRRLSGAASMMQRVGINIRVGGRPSTAGRKSDCLVEKCLGDESPVSKVLVDSALAAELTFWLTEPTDQLPLGLQQEFSDLDGPVQWAVLTTLEVLFVVFGSPRSPLDALVEGGLLTCDDAEHGLRVQRAPWKSLQEHHIANQVRSKMDELRLRSPELRSTILCGHGLGGGYAVLCGLQLLHLEVDVSQILTFGAPQVLIPQPESALCQRLEHISTHHVNAWDPFPRFPACATWVHEVLPLLRDPVGNKSEPDPSAVVKSYLRDGEEALMHEYGHVGSVRVIRSGSSLASSGDFRSTEQRGVLDAMPPAEVQRGIDLLSFHRCAEYVGILRCLQSSPSESVGEDSSSSC